MTQNTYTGLIESSIESNNLQTCITEQPEQTGSNEIPWSDKTCFIVLVLFFIWFIWSLLWPSVRGVLGFIIKLVFGIYLLRFLRHGGRI